MLTKRLIACFDIIGDRVTKAVNFQDNIDVGQAEDLALSMYGEQIDELIFYDITASAEKRKLDINTVLWLRRRTTKFNGVPYIIQRGAEAVFTDKGLYQTKENVDYYMKNAHIISDTLKDLSIWFVGGENSPYIWLECPKNMSSWDFFDYLLTEAQIVGTPGIGFGSNGEGFLYNKQVLSAYQST